MPQYVYGFSDSKFFTTLVKCQIDQLSPNQYLTPAQATETAPPTPPTGKVLQWSGGGWAAVTPPSSVAATDPTTITTPPATTPTTTDKSNELLVIAINSIIRLGLSLGVNNG